MPELRGYQEDHVQSLAGGISGLLGLRPPKTCVLKSPTGSGKTIMMAEVIRRLGEYGGHRLSFIWISVHNLHAQSREKLEAHYGDAGPIGCAYFEELQDGRIQENEVLFFNWESIRSKSNIYVRENEGDHNLSGVIRGTREEGRKVVLVIDESHHSAGTELAQEVIDLISPDVSVEVSATPGIAGADYVEGVDIDEVREAGMIKRRVKINHGLAEPSGGTNEWIMDAALKKREELRRSYERAGSAINPLVLIQIPDRKAGMGDMADEVSGLLAKRGIAVDNGRLAIYLSEDRRNLEEISRPDSGVEALIFKQAIAIGWDCPRASILVLFREWRDYTFSIQTVGRIMRMPEARHYGDDALDNAYVYTNMARIEVAQDVAADYITRFESRRDNSLYSDVNLPSIHIRRQHARTRLDSGFVRIFASEAKRHGLADRVNMSPAAMTRDVLTEAEIEHIDRRQAVEGRTVGVALGEVEVQWLFDLLALGLASESGFAARHSSATIKRAIYAFFGEHGVAMPDAQRIALDEGNRDHIVHVSNMAVTRYAADVAERGAQEVIETPGWNVPRITEYTRRYERRECKKCAVAPMYALANSNEAAFMDFLDREGNSVRWWYKNGEGDKKYLAIRYADPATGRFRAFYVDFVVRMEDGRVGLFDTKAGHTETGPDTAPKARALAGYVGARRGLFGGIAVFRDGVWLWSDRADYAPCTGPGEGWRLLDLG